MRNRSIKQFDNINEIYCIPDEEFYRSALNIKVTCEQIISFMMNYRGSIRQCSDFIGVPKSTIHSYIHGYIRLFYEEDYREIVALLRYNKKNRCKARRYW